MSRDVVHSADIPPLVTDGNEIARLLTLVGSTKLGLPFSVRGLLNNAGLHVQLQSRPSYQGRDKKTEWILKAGGSFRSYFEARFIDSFDPSMLSEDDNFTGMMASLIEPGNWNVYRLNHKVWGRRFAHLAWPMYEVAGNLKWMHVADRLGDANQLDRITKSIEHLKRSGSWLGVSELQCASCGAKLQIWDYDTEIDCPHCGVRSGVKNPELSTVSDSNQSTESSITPEIPTKIRSVRLESTEDCQKCRIHFPSPLDSSPFDFLDDNGAHTSEFDHRLLWEGDIEVPDIFDIANIRETCALFVKGLLAAKGRTSHSSVYRFGIERPVKTEEQLRLLGITEPLDPMQYRYFTGGPAGIAKEIGRFIQKHKCAITDDEIRQAREGLSGFDLKMFNVDLTLGKM